MDWIKIVTSILNHRKIKIIRQSPEGDSCVLLWFLLLLEAGKSNRGGFLMITEGRPYTEQTISMVTDIALPTVQLGMGLFRGLGMVGVTCEGVFYIKNWTKYQSEDRLERARAKNRERQQRFREKHRVSLGLLPPPKDHNVIITEGGNVTSRRRGEKRRQEKKEKGVQGDESPSTVASQEWELAKASLQSSICPSDFKLWIEPLLCIRDGPIIELVGPDPFFCSWIKENYLGQIQDALPTNQVRLVIGQPS